MATRLKLPSRSSSARVCPLLSPALLGSLRSLRSLPLWLSSLTLVACDDEVTTKEPRSLNFQSLETQQQEVVYGADSRRDYYELSATAEAVWRDRARLSTGLLVRPQNISVQNGQVTLRANTLGQSQNLCEGERFATQPEPGYCSGTLIAPNLFLTAGHCIDNADDCANTSVVFQYVYTSSSALNPLTSADLYQCQSIVARRNSSGYDYAIVRLDRAASAPLTPAPLNLEERPLELGEALTLIGGPNGVPVKVDSEGRLTNRGGSSQVTFNASLDAFGGNSGSAIYDALGVVVGILVQGRTDYYTDPNLGCRRVAEVSVNSEGQPTDGGGAETGVYVGRALDALCLSAPTHQLCLAREAAQGGADAGSMGGAEAGSSGSGGATGGGEVSCADPAEPDDVSAQATPFSLGRVVTQNFCDDNLDWLSVTLEAAGALEVETYRVGVKGSGEPNAPFEVLNSPLDLSAPNTSITLYDAALNILSEDNDSGDGSLSLARAEGISAGSYLARVRDVSAPRDVTLSYGVMARLACAEDAHERLPSPYAQHHDDLPSLLLPTTQIPSSSAHALCDEDWRKLEISEEAVTSAGVVHIETRVTQPTDTVLSLYSSAGELIAENDDGPNLGLGSAIDWTPSAAGVYWLRVRAYQHLYGGDRPYQLVITAQEVCDDLDNDQDGLIDEGLSGCLTCVPDDYEDNDTLAEAINIGVGYELPLNHCLDDQDWFSFSLIAGQVIDIETLVERRADTIIELYNRQGDLIAQNDDAAQGVLSSALRSFVAPYTGGYWLLVREYNQNIGPEFSYRLLVREGCADDALEPDDVPLEAQRWSPQEGALTSARSLCDSDWLRFEAEAGRRFTFEARDQLGASPTLEVSRDFGRVPLAVARDLGAEGLTRLTFEAPSTGSYWLSLTSFDLSYGGDHPYELTLTPLPAEQCNDLDDDLDGEVDEGAHNACGVCGAVPAERCDGLDNDCDGVVDEGTQNACGGCGLPPEERCDGVDNDCDGLADEGVLNACGACGEPPEERCDGLDNDCDGTLDEGVLNACGRCGPDPLERCDGLDNDCDGALDEDLPLNACGGCGEAPIERCDEVDNDCDGVVDEGVINACGVCGEAPTELCNRVDDDCDGEVDEGLLNACGECGPTPEEQCDDVYEGADEDCDGVIDEGCSPMSAGVEGGSPESAGVESSGVESAGADSSDERGGTSPVVVIGSEEDLPPPPEPTGHIGAGCQSLPSIGRTQGRLSSRAERSWALVWLALAMLISRRVKHTKRAASQRV